MTWHWTPHLQHQRLDIPARTPRASHFRHIVSGNLPPTHLGQHTPSGSTDRPRASAALGAPEAERTPCPRPARQMPRPLEMVRKGQVTPHQGRACGGGQLRPICPHPRFLTAPGPLLQGQRKDAHPTDEWTHGHRVSKPFLPPAALSPPLLLGSRASSKLETEAASRSELISHLCHLREDKPC